MQTNGHAYWTHRVVRRVGGRTGPAVAGSVAPDVPAALRLAFLLLRGYGGTELLDRAYHRSPWRELHLAIHSVVTPAAVVALAQLVGPAHRPTLRALAAGWLSHQLVDYATHADDAWPPLWPLSQRRVRALSYWQPEHGARELGALEVGALAVMVLGERRTLDTALTVGEMVFAARALFAGDDMWSQIGWTPDRDARARDLES
ncbi:MAG: hypothetical protein ACR2NA_06565 [Solirubrobacterales bacterium]